MRRYGKRRSPIDHRGEPPQVEDFQITRFGCDVITYALSGRFVRIFTFEDEATAEEAMTALTDSEWQPRLYHSMAFVVGETDYAGKPAGVNQISMDDAASPEDAMAELTAKIHQFATAEALGEADYDEAVRRAHANLTAMGIFPLRKGDEPLH